MRRRSIPTRSCARSPIRKSPPCTTNTFAPRFPDVSGECLRATTCLYTVTPDAKFIVDKVRDCENIVFASACSGHGFKHSAAVGEALALWALGRPSAIDLSPSGWTGSQDEADGPSRIGALAGCRMRAVPSLKGLGFFSHFTQHSAFGYVLGYPVSRLRRWFPGLLTLATKTNLVLTQHTKVGAPDRSVR